MFCRVFTRSLPLSCIDKIPSPQLLAKVDSMVTTSLIEHPKAVSGSKALEKLEKEVTIPLMLTAKERKRIRREERIAKQEVIS
jgi:hypothetical protein